MQVLETTDGVRMKPTEKFARIDHLVSACQSARFREQRGSAREAGHLAMEVERSTSDLTEEELGGLLEALRLARRHHTYPGKLDACIRRVAKRQRELSGRPDPGTIGEAVHTLDIEMGTLALHDGDSGLPDAFYESGATYRNARSDGLFFDIGLGADCRARGATGKAARNAR